MAIPARFIDELVSRCDIVDVVSDYVPLHQKGGSHWGLCPFHGERTPSFHVQGDRQMFHCFGCGKGGGVLSFVMEMENLPYPEAVRLLSKRAGLTMPEEEEDGRYRQKRDRLLALNKEAARFFYSKLYDGEGAEALAYLQGRGLSKNTLTRFGLGFAPPGWDRLLTEMGKIGYDKRDLVEAGLAVSGDKGRIYDRFRNRVMFPIIDLRGDVVGFGGRVMDDSTPKYLNSSDTPVFNKSNQLFALNLARKTKLGRILLTEGYMDTIALYQAGFDCAVASLGTAFTQQHAKLLSRYTKEVIIAFDSDQAGVTAAGRAIPLLEKAGLSVRVLQIQGAKDPDEYIKTYGRESFAALLDRSEDHVDYSIAKIREKYRLEEDSEKITFAQEAAELISGLGSPVEREVYAGRVAAIAGIEKDAILQEVSRAFKRRVSKEKKKQERQDLLPTQKAQPAARALRYENLRSALAEEGILRLLTLDETLFHLVEPWEEETFSSPFLGRVFTQFRALWREGRRISLDNLAESLTPEEISHLAGILEKPESLANGKKAMADYQKIMESERITRAGDRDEEALLSALEVLKKRKS